MLEPVVVVITKRNRIATRAKATLGVNVTCDKDGGKKKREKYATFSKKTFQLGKMARAAHIISHFEISSEVGRYSNPEPVLNTCSELTATGHPATGHHGPLQREDRVGR